MKEDLNLGEQPILAIIHRHSLAAHDIVRASEVPMTYKMLSRAIRGRRLTKNTMKIVCAALNNAAKSDYSLSDIFNYQPYN